MLAQGDRSRSQPFLTGGWEGPREGSLREVLTGVSGCQPTWTCAVAFLVDGCYVKISGGFYLSFAFKANEAEAREKLLRVKTQQRGKGIGNVTQYYYRWYNLCLVSNWFFWLWVVFWGQKGQTQSVAHVHLFFERTETWI